MSQELIPPTGGAGVWGVVPAAGLGRRMGRPKTSLPYGDSTIAATVVRTLLDAGVQGLVIVTRSDLIDQLRTPHDPRVHVAVNDDADTQMIDSIRIGLDAVADAAYIPESHSPLGGVGRVRGLENASTTSQGANATTAPTGIVVLPADMPTVTVPSVRACLHAFRETPHAIVIAVHRKRRGHPIIFPWSLREVVRHLNGGLRELPALFPDRVQWVETDDHGVTQDVDTPEDYGRLPGR